MQRFLSKLRQSEGFARYLKLAPSRRAKINLLVLGVLSSRRFQSSWPNKLGRRLFPTLCIRIRFGNEIKITLDPFDASHRLIFDEVFIKRNYDLRRVSFQPDVIIDCGAHIGLFTTLASITFPFARCLAFEPNPQNVHLFRRQISSNKLEVEFFPAAVSDKAGQATLNFSCSCDGRLGASDRNDIRGVKVETVNLIELVRDLGSHALLLKMDIEGEEESLLPAVLPYLPQRCGIFFETHFGEASWRRHADRLAQGGFAVSRLNVRGSFSDSYASRGDGN